MSKWTKEIAVKLETAVNSTAFSANDVAENFVNGEGYEAGAHRTIQQYMADFAFALIFKLADAYEKKHYDGRNEMACKKAHRIAELIKQAGAEYENDPEMWSLANRYGKKEVNA